MWLPTTMVVSIWYQEQQTMTARTLIVPLVVTRTFVIANNQKLVPSQQAVLKEARYYCSSHRAPCLTPFKQEPKMMRANKEQKSKEEVQHYSTKKHNDTTRKRNKSKRYSAVHVVWPSAVLLVPLVNHNWFLWILVQHSPLSLLTMIVQPESSTFVVTHTVECIFGRCSWCLGGAIFNSKAAVMMLVESSCLSWWTIKMKY